MADWCNSLCLDRVDQHADSLRYRAELAVVFHCNVRKTIASTHLHLPTEGWPGCVDLSGWLERDTTGIWAPDVVTHPSTNRARREATMLTWPMPYAKAPSLDTAVHSSTKSNWNWQYHYMTTSNAANEVFLIRDEVDVWQQSSELRNLLKLQRSDLF